MFPVERISINGGDSDSQTFGNFMAGVEAEGAAVATVSRGDTIPLGGLTLNVVHPGELSGDSNEDSVVLLLDCAEVETLLTGDAETLSEEKMIASGALFVIDVLKIGHHGSLQWYSFISPHRSNFSPPLTYRVLATWGHDNQLQRHNTGVDGSLRLKRG